MAERIKSLKELREKHGYTLDQVADALGVTTPSIWQWEQKPVSWFKDRHIKMLSILYPEDEVRQVLDPAWQEPEPEEERIVTGLTDSELEHMLRELHSVFASLSDDDKQDLVDYADFLYHRSHGLKLPRITPVRQTVPPDAQEMIDRIRQTPVMP